MKKSGRARRIVSYMRRPPHAVLMPQPWPTVSADQANVTSRAFARRRQKRSSGGNAEIARVGEIFELHAIKNPLAGRNPCQIDARGVARRVRRLRPAHAPHVLKRFGRRPFDEHAGRAIGAAPDDGAIARHIAAGGAVRNLRAGGVLPNQGRSEVRTRRPLSNLSTETCGGCSCGDFKVLVARRSD